jgi:hypothetical protein
VKPMSAPCDRISGHLPAFLDEPGALAPDDRRHVERCLRCQADLARSRRIHRIMAAMRTESVPADPSVIGSVLAGLDSAADRRDRRDRQRVKGRRAASFVGLAAATAAGVGGVLVLATRRRTA